MPTLLPRLIPPLSTAQSPFASIIHSAIPAVLLPLPALAAWPAPRMRCWSVPAPIGLTTNGELKPQPVLSAAPLVRFDGVALLHFGSDDSCTRCNQRV
ncbi:hypothetical protein [Paraburkholderia sp. UCT2]|uniref:hypothetical protein n=1 Tax=Paraburkholderia sp. UCT2 TaxID=2615208 RepID=UPI0016550141|nr:hypothetical protein [Paraburkholderia sp. UCT2]